jgi:Outer membrane protein beta-barrel domain
MIFRKLSLAFLLSPAVLLFANLASAQVAPTALRSPLSLTVGGTVSVFDPNYISNKLIGFGGYVDLNVFHGIGVEAEGRWQRFHEYQGISQDNYLIGPRVQILHLWRARPYVKALGGFSNMNFGPGEGNGRFTTLAFGGGVDLHLTRHWSVRPVDVEYQYWPTFFNGSLTPVGVSAGVSYRIF